MGVREKYNVEAMIPQSQQINNYIKLFLKASRSVVAMPKPIPMIGPIIGETSMAPITTAAEFTFKPNEQIKIANTNIHKFVPLKTTPLSILDEITSKSSFFLRRKQSIEFLRSNQFFHCVKNKIYYLIADTRKQIIDD